MGRDASHLRHLVPPRSEWPVHEPRRVRAHEMDFEPVCRVPIMGWRAWQGFWWILWRPAVRNHSFGDPRCFPAAKVQLNGPTDPEIRFRVFSPIKTMRENHEPLAGVANCWRALPLDTEWNRRGTTVSPVLDTLPPLDEDLMGQVYSSRGIYPARPGDFLRVMQWADKCLDQLWKSP